MNFSAEKPTLVVHNQDLPGHVAKVTSVLAQNSINIATMQLYRAKRGGYAVMVLELDQGVKPELIRGMEEMKGITKVTYINLEESDHGV